MKLIRWGLLMVGAFWFSVALAQPCPPGFYAPYCDTPQQQPDNGLDGTLSRPPLLGADLNAPIPPARLSEQPPVYPPTVINGTATWGALAKDYQQGGIAGMGVANNRLSYDDAAISAIMACQQNGGQKCEVETVYTNRCLGIAMNAEQVYRWELDVTRDLAGRAAMQTCAQHSQSPCELIYMGCSAPVQ